MKQHSRLKTSLVSVTLLAGLSVAMGMSAESAVYVNKSQLTSRQLYGLKVLYGSVPSPGRYWYDSRSGLFGIEGSGAVGFLQPGHSLGPLASDASSGDTNLFLNGRELKATEAAFYRRLGVTRGHWWLDGYTGLLGMQGYATPVISLFGNGGASEAQTRHKSYTWRSNNTDAYGGSDGKCSYVSIPGSGSVMTGDCN
jgi:hypothetical protein